MSQFWKPGAEKPRLLDDEEGGVVFFATSSGGGYANLERQRQRLPVFNYPTAILYSVETRATTIVVGETGSGKTTQIPQYLKEAGWADGGRVIACTQPRRLAVQSVAARVAEEMGIKLGEEVGYTIRFEDATSTGVTMIKFLTDGVLLREMMDDPLLTKYSVIMVDEAHERSISTDILLGLLKKIQKRRPELRLIISSATIQAKSMAAFFQASKRRRRLEGEEVKPIMEPAVLSVEGRGFNVQIHYVEEPVADYLRAAVSTVLLIHDKEPVGDILVFLTGQDDIDAAVQLITEETQNHRKNSSGKADGISKWVNARPSISSKSEESLEGQQKQVLKKKNSQLTDKSWTNQLKAACLLILGIGIMIVLANPLMETIQDFSTAASIPSFFTSYVLIPLAINYGQALEVITSAQNKTEASISLALSEIYNGVFMNNVMGLTIFLALVYIRNLSWGICASVLVVVIICSVMGLYTSFSIKFSFWTCVIAYMMYPISLLMIYVLTSFLGWT